MIAWLRDYASRRLNSRLADERRCFPPHVFLDLGRQGFFGLQVPTDFGGQQLSHVDMLRVIEQISAIDLSLALCVGDHNGLGVRPIQNFGSERVQSDWLPELASGRQLAAFAMTERSAGSNPNAIEARAVRHHGGWRVRARKQWIGLGSWAGVMSVYAKAQDENGVSLGTIGLLVPADSPGLVHGPESLTTGMRGIVQNTIHLDDVYVANDHVLGEVGRGFHVAQDAMHLARLGIAAMSLGAMRRSLQLMLRYAERREIATGRLLDNPVTLVHVGDLARATSAVESLVYTCGELLDLDASLPQEFYLACKVIAPELLGSTADRLVQLLGGRGYIETNIAPQIVRDARVLRIFEGPTETLCGHLGSILLQDSGPLCGLLETRLQAADIATRLTEIAEHVNERLRANAYGGFEQRAASTWAAFRLGQAGAYAILAACTDYCARQSSDEALSLAREWAADRTNEWFQALEADDGRSRRLTAGEAANLAASLADRIGEVEQQLPAADWEVDELLVACEPEHAAVDRPRAVERWTVEPPDNSGTSSAAVPGGHRPDSSSSAESIDRTAQDAASDELSIGRLQSTVADCVRRWLREEFERDQVAVALDESFTQLGLDSVTAVSLGMEIEAATGVELTADLIYEHQTVRQLSDLLAARLASQGTIVMNHGPTGAKANRSPTPETSATAPTTASHHDANGRHAAATLRASLSENRPLRSMRSAARRDAPSRSATSQHPRRGVDRRTRWHEQLTRVRRMRQSNAYYFGSVLESADSTHAVIDGQRLLVLSSFSYLGLIGHSEIDAAAQQAIAQHGTGSHGVRMVAGTTNLHDCLEKYLAHFVAADGAVVYNAGYLTNVATIGAVAEPTDVIVCDEFNHASLMDGCRLSGAKTLSFKHNDVNSLRECLQAACRSPKLVVVDGVYSMEGDLAPLPEIVELCDEFDALLMVDEAHSLGVLGATGRGVQEHFGLDPSAIDVKMGTLSKSLTSVGGYIAGDEELIDYLRHNAGGYLFSTPACGAAAAAALTALEILEREPQRVARLQQASGAFIEALRSAGFRLTNTSTPIIPILCESEEQTLQMVGRCRREGLFTIPIFYPAVPMNAPRIRLNVLASHTDDDLEFALDVLCRAGREVGLLS